MIQLLLFLQKNRMMSMSMYDMVSAFPRQIKEAMDIGQKARLRNHDQPIHNILVSGMGGSGIGANFVEMFYRNQAKVPFVISKSYSVPSFVNQNSLAIISSYSGNTEETISSFRQMDNTGAKRVVISSGGTLMDFAKQMDLDFIQLPSGWSSPRACLAYSMIAQLYVMRHFQQIDDAFENELASFLQWLETGQKEMIDDAREIATFLKEKWIVIYSPDHLEPVAMRFRQQINENSKMLCWHHVIPEMNHNELVGWRWNQPALATLFIRDQQETASIKARTELTKEVVGLYTSAVMDVYPKGNGPLSKALYLVHLLDFVSVFLAEFNQVDPVEVKVIDFLKNELAKLNG